MKIPVFQHNRRGISQVIGSLMMVAIVASLGSVLLFQGMNATNDFNNLLSQFIGLKSDSAREDILIEHVRLHPSSEEVQIYVRNVGIVDSTVNSVAMVKIDTQHKIIKKTDIWPIPMGQLVLIEIKGGDVDLSHANTNPNWGDSKYSSSEYRIDITTIEGSSFEKVISPHNT